ncbi:ABC transporter permease [Planococcus sp. CAU13]|uniref:ABC transporter permease n=1 Tax=Planococcus sp. CAU13 TaxID=1541197 RepID=UPI0005300503|nr:ABC transporter permease [Planococcus sp. CAU13]
MKELLANPVLIKEIKLRFRNMKSFTGLFFYLMVMGIFVFGFINLTSSVTGGGFFRPAESFMLFSMLSYIQLGLILFITPGLTAGTISSEREKQTLNILLTTAQSSFQIIFGKLLSSIAFLLLLVVSGLPIYSMVFLYGGVAPSQIAVIFLFYFLTLLVIGSLGVMYSTLTRRTITSMIVTYGTTIFLTAVTGFFLILTVTLSGAAMGSGISPLSYFWASINPAVVLLTLLEPGFNDEISLATGIPLPLWVSYSIFYILIFIAAMWLSVSRLRVNMNKYR